MSLNKGRSPLGMPFDKGIVVVVLNNHSCSDKVLLAYAK